jgi:transposase InsO family protein
MARDGVPVTPEFAALVMRQVSGERFNVRAECARVHCSTTTFYKYLERVKATGVEGFYPRSRRPQTSPNAIGVEAEEVILKARKELDGEGWYAGADSIRFQLQAWRDGLAGTDIGDGQLRCGLLAPMDWPPGLDVPARATINRVLDRRGQLLAVPKRRPRAANRRFEAKMPNTRWQIDGFDVWLTNGPCVCVLQIIDDCSRYDVALRAVASENAADVWATVQAAVTTYGLPAEVLSDNGTGFSGARRGWISPLTETLSALGVRHITSSVGHPQTCGKDERAHQTVRHWLDRHPPFDTIELLNEGLATYRTLNNHDRRRTHLSGMTSAQRYQLGPIDGPDGTHAPPATITTKKVTANGKIFFNRTAVGIGRRYAGNTVTVVRQDQRIVVINDHHLIAEFTLTRGRRYQSANKHAKQVSAKS